jgi:FkbM family methyltransferase
MNSARVLVRRLFESVGLRLERARNPLHDIGNLVGCNAIEHIVDGGAFDGGMALALAGVFPRAIVHAFEPHSSTFNVLRQRVAHHARIRTYRLALSDQSGIARFHQMVESHTSSLLAPLNGAAKNGPPLDRRLNCREVSRCEPVTTVTLDSWSADCGCNPDLVKLDLQGHEGPALRGAERILKTHVRAVMTEINFRRTYEDCTPAHLVFSLLDAYGFRFHRLYDIIAGPSDDWQLADAVFIKWA